MDGTPTLRMNEFVLASLANNKIDLGPERTAETGKSLAAPEELVFEINAEVQSLVKESEQRFDELVGKHDLHVCPFFASPQGAQVDSVFLGPALRRLWKGCHQKVQGLPGCLGPTPQTARFPKDVWKTWSHV